MRIDLHVHTAASHDGLMKPRGIIKTAIKRGLDGIAVTDHNTFSGVEAVVKAAPEGFLVIPGVEFSTDMGHVLALFIGGDVTDGIERDAKGRVGLSALSRAVRGAGGLLIAAHPFHGRAELPAELDSLVDGMETHNSREMARDPRSVERVLGAAGGLWTSGGSDAHLYAELGRAYTILPDGADARESLRAGLGVPGGKAAGILCLAAGKLYRRVKRYERSVLRTFAKGKQKRKAD